MQLDRMFLTLSLTHTYFAASQPFDYFILTTIAVNCVLLALNTPLPKGDKSDTNLLLVSKSFWNKKYFVAVLLKVDYTIICR